MRPVPHLVVIYAPQDRVHFDDLARHLRLPVRQGLLQLDDIQGVPLGRTLDAIHEVVAESDQVVCLLSPEFFNHGP